MSLSPGEFLRIADAAIATADTRPWWKRCMHPNPVALSLTVPTPLLGGPTGRWSPLDDGTPSYDFTVRKVRQLRAIVLSAAAAEAAAAELDT